MNKTTNEKPAPGPAWRAAEEYGVDMSLIEDSLAKTPMERLQANDDALELILALQEASEHSHAKTEDAAGKAHRGEG